NLLGSVHHYCTRSPPTSSVRCDQQVNTGRFLTHSTLSSAPLEPCTSEAFFDRFPASPPRFQEKILPAAHLVEEERTPNYNARHFYPVRLYEILNNRYQVAAKIGWGTSSTVWLARDLYQWRWLPSRYVAIKVQVDANSYSSPESAQRELRILEEITRSNPQHIGRNFVATLLDSFCVASSTGTHTCMVFDVLCEPLWILKRRFQGNTIPLDVLKPISKLILEGLHYLHNECHVSSTSTCWCFNSITANGKKDLKSDNILLSLRKPSILDSVAQDEMDNPSPRKHLDDRDIYLSRNHWALSPNELGRSVITDFGLAVRGDGPLNSQPIQPDGYRAPEVCLGYEWSYSVDIWNLGVMLWDLFYGRGPFDTPPDLDRPVSADEAYLGQIISILGPPPAEILSQGKNTSQYFDAQGTLSIACLTNLIGKFKFPELVGKNDLLSMAQEVDDDNSIPEFVELISQMLRWKPEDRSTAEGLLSHPWLPQMKPSNG
ncbi:hypothetical protein N7528_008852, partial [Penicillium herquei]